MDDFVFKPSFKHIVCKRVGLNYFVSTLSYRIEHDIFYKFHCKYTNILFSRSVFFKLLLFFMLTIKTKMFLGRSPLFEYLHWHTSPLLVLPYPLRLCAWLFYHHQLRRYLPSGSVPNISTGNRSSLLLIYTIYCTLKKKTKKNCVS